MGRVVTQPDLPLTLDRGSDRPLGAQLVAQLRGAILGGQLAAGTRLPATRALAAALGVSRNVVVAAYDELFAEGCIVGRHGSGTYVGGDLPTPGSPSDPLPGREPPPPIAARWLRRAEPVPPALLPTDRPDGPVGPPIEFRPGTPSLEPLARDSWRRIWRAVGDEAPPGAYGPPAGDPALREELARYLGRARGIACGPEDIVVTSGSSQAFDLLVRATLAPGDAAAIEEPGYRTARQILLECGARLVPIPVDDDGLRVDRLPRGAAAPLLAYVTPSHQYPLGGRLPVARRLALLEWAREGGSLIVEDDYDSEFRFDAPPLAALMGLGGGVGGGQVAYLGTFSKSLSPALRVGWLVAPPPLRERVVRLKAITDYHTSWPVQRALAALLARGELDRHIRRMRRHYAAKRALLGAALAPSLGGASGSPGRLIGLEAGLHAVLEFAPGCGLDPTVIAAMARARGVLVGTLESFYAGTPDRRGLLLGYGGLSTDELARGAGILAEVIGRASEGRGSSSGATPSTGRSRGGP